MSLKHCRICDSPEFEEVFPVEEMMFGTKRIYFYYKCKNCGALQIENPEKEQQFLYPSSYYSFSSRAKTFKNKIKKFLMTGSVAKELRIASFPYNILPFWESKEAAALKGVLNEDAKILDVGCGTGELIIALYDLGFKKVRGIDPFISETFFYKQAMIEKKSLTDMDDEKFDLIMLHHSFEHMANPLEIMQKIKSILSPSGLCIIRIPVSDSYSFAHYKNNWVQLDAPRHIFLHTNKSIAYLAALVGLKIEKTVDDSGIFQFIGSEQYLKNISLTSSNSFYRPFHKKIFGKKLFSRKQVQNFKKFSEDLNRKGKGDQRIFYLKN